MSTKGVNFLKAELVQLRSVEVDAPANGYEALFSVELPVDDIFEFPNNSTFHVVELLQYRAKKFIAGTIADEFLRIVARQDTTGAERITHRSIYLDTSVPDASLSGSVAEQVNVENRWLASSTNVHFARQSFMLSNHADAAANVSTAVFNVDGRDFTREWQDATDQDGKGPLIVTPRLIVRNSILNRQTGAAAFPPTFTEIIEFQMMYRVRRISKAEMFGLLRRQQAQETLLRAGTAAFPG